MSSNLCMFSNREMKTCFAMAKVTNSSYQFINSFVLNGADVTRNEVASELTMPPRQQTDAAALDRALPDRCLNLPAAGTSGR